MVSKHEWTVDIWYLLMTRLTVDNWYLLESLLADGIFWSAGYLFEDRCQVVSTGIFTDAIDW
jgi:hypothetical protein